MRRVLFALAFSLVAASGAAFSAVVVLKDGTILNTTKPHVVKNGQAIMTLTDGTLVSVPARQVDAQRTRDANMAPPPAPAPVAAAPPQTPAEAARSKAARKATVVLSDEDVLHPIGGTAAAGGAEGEGEGKNGEGRVEVGSVSTSKEGGKSILSGSLQNVGGGEVSGVTLTIEAIGNENTTLASSFGRVAKDTLGAGEKTTFTAEFSDAGIVNYRFLPRWQVKIAVKPAAPGTDAGQAPGATDANPAPEATAPPSAPPPPARAESKPPSRPDYAPPQANAPIGRATDPNRGYLPQPSDVVPVPTAPPQ